jgi:murein DD-endopeptidase MepM/ murein hydrolase activator NlpD
MDWDLRSPGSGLTTSGVARQATADRPRADDRGVISYPGYQVVVARRGDTVTSVATRLGISPASLGRQNAIAPDVPLRAGEVLVLPARVEEPSPATGAPATGPIQPPEQVDVTTIASGAIDRAQREAAATPPAAAQPPSGREPVRHRVARGETVYSIARLYNVPTRALADWNGLGTDLSLREGQTLLIPPVVTTAAAAPAPATAPGQGSPTPEPPSAAQPLPAETPPPASAPTPGPASPALAGNRTAASSAQFAMPSDGRIIRAYEKGKYDGIGIGAAVGSPVRAATDGTVAAITRDTDQVPIIVISHPNNMLTVYANVDGITVAKDARVRRGQQIATVRAGNPAFLHFEVRKGFESVDPMPFLQ